MSKKSRKKSSKTPSGSSTAKKESLKIRASSQTRSAKTQPASASKSSKTGAQSASHKAASKPLKSSEKAAKPAAAASGASSALAEGRKAPTFRLPRDGGNVVTSADYAGQKLVLFFYPRADTPGCTREAIDFTRLKDAFTSADTAVLGISADPLKAQEKFRDKHSLGIPLISDEQHEMLEAYGAWGEKSMYGRKYLGVMRITYLIDEAGKIAQVWPKVSVDGHAEEVLEAAKAL